MNGQRVYAALLALYPEPFRREYGSRMTEMFQELQWERGRSPWTFWLFILSDLGRSIVRQHIDACRSGARRFALLWVAFCTLGIILTGVLANALTWTFGYLYHPYLEGLSLSPWSYGTLLGLGFGIVQAAVLRLRLRLGVAWVLVTMVSTAIGIHTVMLFKDVMNPIDCGVVLGGFVGTGQWLILRTRMRRAGRWVLASAVAVSVGLLSVSGSIHQALAGLNPLPNDGQMAFASLDTLNVLARGVFGQKSWSELAIECVVMAVSGAVVGALTARPIASIVKR
jgi:hypothetical protein